MRQRADGWEQLEMEMMTNRILRWTTAAVFLMSLPQTGYAAHSGLITMPSKYSVEETIQRFEAAIKAKSDHGWMVFTELDHAAAAEKNGLKLPARTVIVFGNPRIGTPFMQKAPIVAIDFPPKALVWQDDQGKVWLTFNSGEYLQTYVYPRHGLPSNPAAAKAFDQFVKYAAEQATE
jgi:uncharacterized protein (DUF302 family)